MSCLVMTEPFSALLEILYLPVCPVHAELVLCPFRYPYPFPAAYLVSPN